MGGDFSSVVQPARASRTLLQGIQWAVFAVCALFLLRNFRGVDLTRAGELIVAGGAWLVFAAVPFALAQALDTEAWRLVLARLGVRVRLHELYPVRVAMEAMTVSMPAGSRVGKTRSRPRTPAS